MEVAGGGVQGGVTQERLDDGDLDAVFQTVRGKAVAQRLPILLISSRYKKFITGITRFTRLKSQ